MLQRNWPDRLCRSVFPRTIIRYFPHLIRVHADWVTDLTVSLEDAQDFLPGYGRVIKGFKERIYPTEVSNLGATRPWDTIRYALCKVSEKLARARADEGRPGKINVWFTGHSRVYCEMPEYDEDLTHRYNSRMRPCDSRLYASCEHTFRLCWLSNQPP